MVTVITVAISILPFTTMGRSSPAPTAMMQLCGGLMMEVKFLIPYMPRLETDIGHHRGDFDLAVHDDGTLLARAHGDDAALRRVDDGGEILDPVHAQIGNRYRSSPWRFRSCRSRRWDAPRPRPRR